MKVGLRMKCSRRAGNACYFYMRRETWKEANFLLLLKFIFYDGRWRNIKREMSSRFECACMHISCFLSACASALWGYYQDEWKMSNFPTLTIVTLETPSRIYILQWKPIRNSQLKCDWWCILFRHHWSNLWQWQVMYYFSFSHTRDRMYVCQSVYQKVKILQFAFNI